MKKTFILLLLSAVVAGAMAQTAQPKALQVKELRLANGLTVWVNEDHSQPKVYGAVVVKAGAADCPDTGIAHYFEHIMFKGTDRIGTVDYAAERPWLDSISVAYDRLAATTDKAQRADIQQHINRLSQRAAEYVVPSDFNNLITRYGGSDLNASTGQDYTVYHNTFAPQYLRQWAMLNSERLLRPVFRMFQNELETVYEEKNQLNDDMLRSTLERINAKAFEGTPYQYSIIGSTENLKNPQLSKMRDFYNRYYVACNMGLILAGDVCADSVKTVLETTFGRLPKGEPTAEPQWRMKPYDGQTYEIKVDVPVVSAEMLMFQGPTAGSADVDALTLALRLLNNEGRTGMLDSLMNDSRLMAGIAFSESLKRAGVISVGIVPNLLAKKSKAENMCREEIERLKRGDFSDEALMLIKRDFMRTRLSELEDIEGRAQHMTEVFGQGGVSWDEYVTRSQAIADISRDDILRVARQYLGDNNFIRFVKKYGSYEKERLLQPGYKPVVAKHADAVSAFARELAEVKTEAKAPRFISVDDDATTVGLAPLATLYAVKNPVDSLFRLDIVYCKGMREDPVLEYAANYLSDLGTDSLTLIQLARSMQQLGASMDFKTGDDAFRLTLTGHDSHFRPALRLFAHFLANAKGDERKLKELKKSAGIAADTRSKNATSVAKAIVDILSYGERSTQFSSLTRSEVKRLTSDELLKAVSDVRRRQCAVIYSGTLAADDVAAAAKEWLHPELSVEPFTDTEPPFVPVRGETMYIYQLDDARQNFVGTYQQLPATPTWSDVADRQLFCQYFGGDMSSLLFKEMREFRSLAYSVESATRGPGSLLRKDDPCMLLTVLSTQVDKTPMVVDVLDSLFLDIPQHDKAVEVARQAIINEAIGSVPSFRNMGRAIASLKLCGYSHDYRADLYEALKQKSAADVKRYFNANVKTAPHAWFIIGRVPKPLIKIYEKFFRVVELQKGDIFNY